MLWTSHMKKLTNQGNTSKHEVQKAMMVAIRYRTLPGKCWNYEKKCDQSEYFAL